MMGNTTDGQSGALVMDGLCDWSAGAWWRGSQFSSSFDTARVGNHMQNEGFDRDGNMGSRIATAY
jgi:hypothetical protein